MMMMSMSMHRRASGLVWLLVAAGGCEGYRLSMAHDQLPLTESGTGSSSGETAESSGAMEDTRGTESTSEGTGDGSGSGGTGHSSSGTSITGGASSEEAGETSTGAAEAVCGNGVLEVSGPVPEECDDGNLEGSDGCGATCALDITVFLSSKKYSAGGPTGLGSTYQADARCANRADDVGFAEPLRYRAWLSDSYTDARDRIKVGRGRLVLVNGLVVAESWAALLAGELQNPINVTEKSETMVSGVWTGTEADGTRVEGSSHCLDWTSASGWEWGYIGGSDLITGEWTRLTNEFAQPSECAAFHSLYCFETLE